MVKLGRNGIISEDLQPGVTGGGGERGGGGGRGCCVRLSWPLPHRALLQRKPRVDENVADSRASTDSQWKVAFA